MFLKSIVATKSSVLGILIFTTCSCSQHTTSIKPSAHVATSPKSPIVALLGVKTIRIEDLWPSLVEHAGSEIMQDAILTIAIRNAIDARGINISPVDIANERQLLSSMSPELKQEEFDEMLKRKGIGKYRLAKLLWRNAALRKLVARDVHVTDEGVERMFSILHGPSYPAKIIVVSTLEKAIEIKAKLDNGESFNNLAKSHSIDPSAQVGGFVNPIAVADPSWPSPLRETLPELIIDDYSNPIFIGDRWVILTVTGIPTTTNKMRKEVDSEIRILARLAQERFLMEELANRLLYQQQVKLIDRDLKRVLGFDAYYAK